jgi:hypothetical protein
MRRPSISPRYGHNEYCPIAHAYLTSVARRRGGGRLYSNVVSVSHRLRTSYVGVAGAYGVSSRLKRNFPFVAPRMPRWNRGRVVGRRLL